MGDKQPKFIASHCVAMPAGVEEQLPTGIALDLLLIDIQQWLKQSATPFLSAHPKPFDLPLDAALAVVRLTDEGFSDTAAWWLAREAAVVECLEGVGELQDSEEVRKRGTEEARE